MRKKKVLMPRIYKPVDGQPRRWHVEFSVFDEIKDKMQRFRKTEGFAKCTTDRQCWANAYKLKNEYSRKLQAGWTPFDDSQNVIWEDDLVYKAIYKNQKPLYRTKRTVAYYSTRFLRTKANTSAGSYKTYMSKLRKLRSWLIKKKLNEKDASIITVEHAFSFMHDLNEIKKSGQTNNEYLRLFKEFWKFMKKDRKGIENIWEDLPRYKKDTRPQRPLKKGVLKLIKEELQSTKPQLWLAAQFMYYCFIRPGELRQMQIRHLDMYEGKVILYPEFTKTDKTRVVDIPDQFSKILMSKYKLHTFPEEFYMFTKQGIPGIKMVHNNYFNKQFAVVRNKLGLPKEYKFYGFKHTGAVVAVRNGADIKEIQHQMGHSNIQITDEYLKNMVGYESEFFRKKMPII